MARAACLIILAMTAAAPARAEPAWTTFATWLRTGPAKDAKIIGELDSGVRVERVACGDGWCQVVSNRAVGFVQAALLAAAPRGRAVPAASGCFPAQHFTMEGPIPMQVCPAVPQPTPR